MLEEFKREFFDFNEEEDYLDSLEFIDKKKVKRVFVAS